MNKQKATLLAFTVPLAWGTSYIFMAYLMDGIPPVTIVALRTGIAFLVMFALFFPRVRRPGLQTLKAGAICGGLLAAVFLCLLLGVRYTSASETGFLQSTTVIMVPVITAVLRKRMPEGKIVAGVAVVTAGLLLLNGGVGQFSAGSGIMLVSAFVYAVHIVVSKSFVERVDSISLGIWQMFFACVYASAAAFLFETPALPQTGIQWGSLLGLTLICSAYGFVMQAYVQKFVSAETTGFMFSLEPVFTAAFAFVFLGERLDFLGYAGALLILLGVMCANLSPKPSIREKTTHGSDHGR
ncbi:DMT family transporter [Lachnoclostridium sp. An14]|uniref:DMT family transporter n=1 Tax=Lachnoclostridium sp. An14 TaxID=1965562 RepID=UPI0013A674F6|nr:DMT family transporter [Lachnoclostridium sp. An14]